MSWFSEAVIGWILDVIAFFDNIKARRDDDELTERHKQLQRSCVWATVLPLFIAVGGFLLGNLLDAFETVLRHTSTLDDLRSAAFVIVMGLFAAAFAYAFACYWRLWRFYNNDGGTV